MKICIYETKNEINMKNKNIKIKYILLPLQKNCKVQ